MSVVDSNDARTSGFFNRLTFGWMSKTAKKAMKEDIVVDELPLPSSLHSDIAYQEFAPKWEAACKAGNPNLRKVLIATFGKDLFLAGLFKLGWSLSLLLGAFFFIRSLLSFVNGDAPFNRGTWQGWILACCFFVDAYLLGECAHAVQWLRSPAMHRTLCHRSEAACLADPTTARVALGRTLLHVYSLSDVPIGSFAAACTASVPVMQASVDTLTDQVPPAAAVAALPLPSTGMLLQHMYYGCMTVGIRIKGALINAVTKKSFQMHMIDKEHAAECVSFVASDINKVYDGCQDIHFLWTAPIEAGGILTILAVLIRQYAFPGEQRAPAAGSG